MVTIKQAAANANRYLTELMSDATDVQLEEVDSTESDWLVTLSFTARRANTQPLSRILGEFERRYKIFSIDKQTGEINSMKIRQLQS